MSGDPVTAVYVDGVSVAKSGVRSYEETRTRRRMASVSELRSFDLTTTFGADLGGLMFDKDASDTTTADDGATCIIDSAGNRFKLVLPPTASQFRLSLATATPAMVSDIVGATTIYYTPSSGGMALFTTDGVSFRLLPCPELSQATTDATKSPAAVANNSNYDMFAWLDGSTKRCTRGPAWSSDTARGTGAGTTELQVVGGVRTNKRAITNGPAAGMGVYAGTVRSNGSAQIDWKLGSAATSNQQASLGVWNFFNRRDIGPAVSDTTGTWTYSAAAWRSLNNTTQNRISAIVGLAEDAAHFRFIARLTNTPNLGFFALGIGFDSTSAPAAQPNGAYNLATSTTFDGSVLSLWAGAQPIGWHFWQALEIADGTHAWTVGGQTYMALQGTLKM